MKTDKRKTAFKTEYAANAAQQACWQDCGSLEEYNYEHNYITWVSYCIAYLAAFCGKNGNYHFTIDIHNLFLAHMWLFVPSDLLPVLFILHSNFKFIRMWLQVPTKELCPHQLSHFPTRPKTCIKIKLIIIRFHLSLLIMSQFLVFDLSAVSSCWDSGHALLAVFFTLYPIRWWSVSIGPVTGNIKGSVELLFGIVV